MIRVFLLLTVFLLCMCAPKWVIMDTIPNDSITQWCKESRITRMKSIPEGHVRVECGIWGNPGDTIK